MPFALCDEPVATEERSLLLDSFFRVGFLFEAEISLLEGEDKSYFPKTIDFI